MFRALRSHQKGDRALITGEREQFVRRVFREVYEQSRSHTNAVIRERPGKELGVTASRETLRPIINEEKARFEEARTPNNDRRPGGQTGDSNARCLPIPRAGHEAMANTIEELFARVVGGGESGAVGENACRNSPPSGTDLPENRNLIPSGGSGVAVAAGSFSTVFAGARFVHHAGLLLVRADIDRVTAGLPEQDRVRQWLGSVLCGAVNIEQSGELSFDALEVLIGPTLRSAYRQRECLHQICSPELRRLSAARLEFKQQWGRELVKREERRLRSIQFVADKKRQLEQIEAELAQTIDNQQARSLRRNRTRLRQSLRAKGKRDREALRKSREKEAELTRSIRDINTRMAAEPGQISRLEHLIENEYRKLNFGPKALFDAIRVTARNIFGRAHSVFRPLYDNYRNDHRLLRELIRAPGVICESQSRIVVGLVPSRRYQPKTRAAVERFLDLVGAEVNARYVGKPIEFRLQSFGPDP